MEAFERVFLNLSKHPGNFRIAEKGLGWKPSTEGEGATFTVDKSDINSAQWSRASKGYEIKVFSRNAGVVQLDGFDQEDFDRAAKVFKLFYDVTLENKEHALRGWNWGKADFGRQELAFNVQNRPAFEIPYSEILNTNLAGKNEVAVEFSLPANGTETGTNGNLGGARARGRKAGAGKDQLVEMRFYIPGVVATKAEKDKDDGENNFDDEEEDAEEQNAANLFYETLMDKADIGDVAGDTIATFLEVLHLTPRGRFDIDMYESSFRLRGKTYDYKIPYDQIKKFMLLPKPDDVHTLITVGLDPPLRQGQTKYPFLVMQFKRSDEVKLELNLTEEALDTKYKDKLNPTYEAPQHSIVAQIFRGLAGKKVITPSKDFVSYHQQSGVKCSIKANEGHLFCLDRSFMFVPKPATYIPFDQISMIVMSRVGGAVSASRTFDITVMTKNQGGIQHQFSNINREEQKPLEDFFSQKNLKVRNEMMEDSGALIQAALKDADLNSSDDEVVGAAADRGSADEDSESEDEDFQSGSDSDVAEEFDSAHESSGSEGSDVEMGDADADGDDDAVNERKVEPKKKKQKTGK